MAAVNSIATRLVLILKSWYISDTAIFNITIIINYDYYGGDSGDGCGTVARDNHDARIRTCGGGKPSTI